MNHDQTTSGRIVMFDGPDGAGKTKQIELMSAYLQQHGHNTYCTRVHGGTPIGEALRKVSLSTTPRSTLTDLYISRTMHVELAGYLQQKKSEGVICLVDRSPASMWAYQVRAGGIDPAIGLRIISEDFDMMQPDVLIIYAAPLPLLKQRIHARSNASLDYFESKPDDFHQTIIDAYSECIQLFGAVMVDASRNIDAVHQDSIQAIRAVMTV